MSVIFDRLLGLETEYAIRFRPTVFDPSATHYRLYRALVESLKRKIPSAEADALYGKPGAFLANGGAIWFEHSRLVDQVGLVEGCTPECRSPRDLLICQRAQDRLLSETARTAWPDFYLLKNCRDSQGESYGAQENYSALLATGWRLRIWQAAWMLLWPLLLLSWVSAVTLCVVVLLGNLVIAGLLYLLICKVARPDEASRQQWRIRLFGWGLATGTEGGAPWPGWLEEPLLTVVKLMLVPGFLLASWLVGITELRRTQRRLLAFLASRAVLGGSGWLDRDGKFHLTEKAQTRRTLWTEAIPDDSLPLFAVAHFCKLAGPFRPRWTELMSPRQRLQICLGDSNLCQEAEYLRIATTALVLDAIEAGAITSPPMLRRPLHAIRQISRDPSLTQTVGIYGREAMTALEIQRWYLDACSRFVATAPDAPEEAHEVLRLWADVLDKLETDRAALRGRLDWVTKQFLLDEAGAELPYAARKKIDMRYHELSPEGYFAQLEAGRHTCSVVSETEIEQAMRLPPVSSPAWKRGRYIREFSGGGLLQIGWRFLTVRGEGGKKTVIDLHDSATP